MGSLPGLPRQSLPKCRSSRIAAAVCEAGGATAACNDGRNTGCEEIGMTREAASWMCPIPWSEQPS
eukprot:6186520-Pleurochrysis_carterae.AAC.7